MSWLTQPAVGSTGWGADVNTNFDLLEKALKDGTESIGPLSLGGNIAMGSNKITGLAAGASAGDSVRYEQVLLLAGGTMTGALTLSGAPTSDLHAATKAYADNAGSASAPAGTISMYGGSSAPSGWLLCDGKTLGKTGSGADYTGDTYKALYDVIQATFGGTYNWDNGDTVDLPDLRGIFARGAGTSETLQDATDTYFSGTLGYYEYDQMQGHRHTQTGVPDMYRFYYPYGIYDMMLETEADTGDPKTDGTNGTPRTGAETRPANLAVTFIIRC